MELFSVVICDVGDALKCILYLESGGKTLGKLHCGIFCGVASSSLERGRSGNNRDITVQFGDFW